MASPAFNPSFTAAYYQQRLLSEYRLSTNLTEWLGANIQLLQDVLACAFSFSPSLDLSQAVGSQLDILGQILGQSRTVSFQPSDSVSPVLDDATYRTLLQAAVLRNHWNGKLSSLRTIWVALFQSGVILITDNQNMTVNFYVAAPLTSILQDLVSHDLILPRPQGVEYIYSFAGLPLLGFDQNSATVAGFGALAFTTTADTTNGDANITVADASGILVDQVVYGPGIPNNTTVSIISGTTITLSENATADQTGVSVGFYTPGSSGHFA